MTGAGPGARASIPDAGRLVAAVLERSTGRDSYIHGEDHWQRVAVAGLALLPETPDADPALVFLFALFHDSMRLNDAYDPLDGQRGAALAGELRGEAFDLEEARRRPLRRQKERDESRLAPSQRASGPTLRLPR